jgi:uncharacterized protein YndB with AHSA1/START domain
MTRPVTVIEPGTVKLERLLPGPIERVWAYLTESDKRAKWLAAGEFELRVGGRITLITDNDSLSRDNNPPEKYRNMKGKKTEGVITRLEPNRVLAHTWIWPDGTTTEVTYELQPRGKDVLLTIINGRLEGRDITASVMGGWDVHTGILEDILKGVPPRPFWATHARLEKQYGAAL